jgi:hypothetical protein
MPTFFPFWYSVELPSLVVLSHSGT